MKKIYIQNGHNTYNYGSFMMLINFIHFINQKEEFDFYIELDTQEDFNRLKNELSNNISIHYLHRKLPQSNNPLFSKIKKFLYGIFLQNKKILKEKPDFLVVLGGDDISNYYGNIVMLLHIFNLKRLSKHVKVFLIGQTMGPFDKKTKGLVFYFLRNMNITLRDSFCQNYLIQELGFNSKEIPVFSDLAFLPLPKQILGENKNIYIENNLKKDKYIVFVPSGLHNSYTDNFEDYLQNIDSILTYLIKKYPEKTILLLGHVLKPEIASDEIIVNKLYDKHTSSPQVVKITYPILASEARYILGNSYFVITGRMHPAISAFQMGIPAISLSYSIKYKGIISDDMNLPELVIEAKGKEKWQDLNIFKESKKYIDQLEKIRPEIINKIKLASKKLETLAKDNIKYFLK